MSLLGRCRKVRERTDFQCQGQMEKLDQSFVLLCLLFVCGCLCTPDTFSLGSCPAAAGVFGSPCAQAGTGLATHHAET